MEHKKSSQKPIKSRDRKSVLQICGPVLQFSHLLIDPMKDVKIQAHRLPFDDTRHFDRDAFEPIEILGNGNFGTVYKGILKQVPGVHSDITIAIKTINYDGEEYFGFDSYFYLILTLSGLLVQCSNHQLTSLQRNRGERKPCSYERIYPVYSLSTRR